jgi:hypothetical protein
MTLIIQKPTGAKLVLAKDFSFDADAAAYIAAVEAADTQALETATRYAINDFVIGCKQDGIWSAIKASCILAGARTLAGALVPLVGAAPSNVGPFVDADYNRKTGLAGNGSSKTLRNAHTWTSGNFTNNHGCVFPTALQTNNASYFEGIGTTPTINGICGVFRETSGAYYSSYTPTNYLGPSLVANSLIAVSRASSSTFTGRAGTNSQNNSQNIVGTPQTFAMSVLARQTGASSNTFYSNARIAFYSFGESLNLALLDARVTDLITAFGVAIP